MNHKFSKSMFCLTIFAVMLLVTASLATWRAAAQDINPTIVASAAGYWFWTSEFNPGSLDIAIYASIDEGAAELWSGQAEADQSGFAFVDYNVYGQVLVPGNYLVISDGDYQKSLVLETITMEVFDTENEIMAGTALAGREVWAAAGPWEWQERIMVTADPDTGEWFADFKTIGFDITEDMRPSSFAQIFDEDGDASEAGTPVPPPNPHFTVFPEWDWFDGMDWPDGATVEITVDGKDQCATSKESWGAFFNGGFGEGCDIVFGDVVRFTDGTTTRIHTVQNLGITKVDKVSDTVAGTADQGAWIHAWVHELGGDQYLQAVDGTWLANFIEAGIDLQELMSGRVEILDEQGNATAVDWSIPNPHFTVFPEWDWFDGMDWPDGATVTISVEGKPECETSKESWGNFFNGPFGDGCDIEFDDVVTFTDGVTTRTHVVQHLKITDIDKSFNEVFGTASEGALLYVWAHGGDDVLEITAGESGNWSADFDAISIDLIENMGGRSEIRDDEGNATAVDWYLPNPHFVVFPEWEWFDGMDWQWEDSVTISVAGKSQCGTIIESPGSFFNGSFGEACDIEFGDVVTFKGRDTTQTHTVRNLAIVKINPEDDLVKGTADAGAEIHVWPHATGQELLVTTNPQGKWEVNFTGHYDLVPGERGRAEIRDDLGNATAVDWYIPRPIFTIYPDAQWFDGNDFPDGATVEITVAGKPECDLEIESWGGFFGGNFPEGCFVTSGDLVKYKQGSTTLTHTVRNLAIKMIDKEFNTVSGVADPGEIVYVWAWYMTDGSTVEDSNTEATTAEDGTWLVNYDELGVVLADGMGIQAMISGPDGNSTSIDLAVPNTHIVASITENWFFLVDFLPDTPLNLSIYDSESNVLWQNTSRTSDVNGFSWINSEGWDLEPGDRITVSDGRTSKELIIEAFTFDVFDTLLGRLEGTAPAPFGRHVWVGIGWENDIWAMDISTDEAGNWVADFETPVPENYSWVAAQIFDADGDASELRPTEVIK